MALTTFNFSQLVSNIATAMQASASVALNFTVGSVLRAISEAVAAVVLWLQAIILQVLTLTRAATSVGADLDSFYADFNFPRLAASNATGQVAFSRFTPTLQAVVPINAAVQTADGTQKFFVTIDITNSAYNAGLGGYVIAPSTSSVNVPVQAVNAGTQGNVLAGSISVLATAISGVDTVTNAADFINGIDAESDAAYRARFPLYLASLSKATKTAVSYAVTSLQQGLSLTITENYDYSGNYKPGTFMVVVDDGTGDPSESLLDNASSAIEAVRALGITYAVFAPVPTTANASLTLTSASGYDHASVVAAVGTALQDFINGIPLGAGLNYTQIASIAYSVPGVINVTSVQLNSATSDIAANQKQKIVCGTLTIA